MRSSLRLAALCALGVAAFGVPARAGAQQGQQAPVQPVLTRIGSNFYAIDGQGGRMGALIGPDGIFMVDAQSLAIAPRILEELRKRYGETDRPQMELDYIERLLKGF